MSDGIDVMRKSALEEIALEEIAVARELIASRQYGKANAVIGWIQGYYGNVGRRALERARLRPTPNHRPR